MPQIELITHLQVEDAEGLLPDGFIIVHETDYREFSEDGGLWHVLCIGFATGVPASLVANFIQKIIEKSASKEPKNETNKPQRMQINRVWTDFDQGQIQRRVEECIKIEV